MKLVVIAVALSLCTACTNLRVDESWKSNLAKDVARNNAMQQCNEYPKTSSQYDECVEKTQDFYNTHQRN